MRKLAVVTFLFAVAAALPLQAARGKNESYISYDDGGTIVRGGDDNREIDARLNLPVFPGDEVITNRRGRAEVRLADGNVVAIDRATAVRFRSVLDSYDGESNDTIVELRYGKVSIYRSDNAQESLRLDTPSGSYYAGKEAVFSVESDSKGRDHVAVFDGAIEVRTPNRTSRVRSGESADVDDRGLYGLVSDDHSSADDFERWFLKRIEKYDNSNSRYLDRTLAYSDEDLSAHGSWTFITGFGWGWRPYVSVGWRPYYYGEWYRGRSGCLTWASYEPWGWVPYHYGRWSYDQIYGWFWLPGASYSPAWVYWMYSPGYVGWAPAGWYDCYRPYYDWAYRPYSRGADFGFGFYGRVRVGEIDLRPWTFIDANNIISNRIDRAAIGADIVRGRLVREPGALATITGSPARFSRREIVNPAEAVNGIIRRGFTGATGQVVPPTDVTPFFRRDADLPGTVRDRIVRTRPADTVAAIPARGLTGGSGGSGSIAPIGSGSVAPIGSGGLAPIGRGSVAPVAGGGSDRINRGDNNGGDIKRDADAPRGDTGGRITRVIGGEPATSPAPREGGRINRGSAPEAPRSDDRGSRDRATAAPATVEPSWRTRIVRGGADPGVAEPSSPAAAPRDTWRGGVNREAGGETPAAAPAEAPAERSRAANRGSSDVPRRVIDGIVGGRVSRGDSGDRSSGRPARESAPPPRAPEARPPAPARESSPPPARESAPPRRENSDGGRVHRDKSE